MKKETITNFVTYADPELLDIAYQGRDILRILEPCLFYRAGDIARMVNQPKRETRKRLMKLVSAGLVYTDQDSDPDGKILFGTLPTDDDFPWQPSDNPHYHIAE